jgi:hypothetical protein
MNIRKVFLLAIGSLALIGAGAAGAKIYSRLKSAHMCDDVENFHRYVRLMDIESVISQRGGAPSYLMIGDSITEMADLPEICGRKPINAGISGATLKTFQTEGRRLADLAKPDFIIVALGTNDAIRGQTEEFQERLKGMLTSLSPWKLIIVPAPPTRATSDTQKINGQIASLPVPQAAKLDHADTMDGIHLVASSYVAWKNNIVEAANASVCE